MKFLSFIMHNFKEKILNFLKVQINIQFNIVNKLIGKCMDYLKKNKIRFRSFNYCRTVLRLVRDYSKQFSLLRGIKLSIKEIVSRHCLTVVFFTH